MDFVRRVCPRLSERPTHEQQVPASKSPPSAAAPLRESIRSLCRAARSSFEQTTTTKIHCCQEEEEFFRGLQRPSEKIQSEKLAGAASELESDLAAAAASRADSRRVADDTNSNANANANANSQRRRSAAIVSNRAELNGVVGRHCCCCSCAHACEIEATS